MRERLLIISDKEKDLELFKEILVPEGFDISSIDMLDMIEEIIDSDAFGGIVADYDLTGDKVYDLIGLLHKNRSRSCLILYGDKSKADRISELLQAGAYGFIPRPLLSDRIHDTILGGLENRKAFIEILGMIDEMRNVNEMLIKEKEALRRKNEELGFINRLSSAVAYELNWGKILPRILDAGLLKVMDSELVSIFYRIGSKWNLAIHLSGREINKEILERLKEDMVRIYFSLSGKKISAKETSLHLYPSNVKVSCSSSISISKQWVMPLSLAGAPLGMLVILPRNEGERKNGKKRLISTISNILAISLKNAQEYHRLKEMAITDGLTGVYNHKGFKHFIRKEFKRVKRYRKPLSLIMIDVDNFKVINDTFGHQCGDYILRELAAFLKSSVRETDIVARYGGDEFAIILPETERGRAGKLIKRMSNSIMNHPFQWGSERIKVEISYGISTAEELQNREGEEEFIRRADLRLYIQKQSRNLLYGTTVK